MIRHLSNFATLFLFSRRGKTVRKLIVFLFANFLMIAGVVFSFEVVLIILGVNNIILPVNSGALAKLAGFFF